MRCLLVCTTASKLYSIRSRTTGTHAWQSLFWSSLECWSLGSKTRCESAEVSKVAVEDLCCLLFVFPTSALLKREENVALGTAAQLRWTAARTEKRKASISRAWSLEALYCLYVFVVLCQRMLRAQVWATDMRRLGHVRWKEDGRKEGKERSIKMHICRHRAPV